jgi:hypothetical protein
MFIVTVPSSKGDKSYTIRKVGEQLVCDCHDHLYRSHGKPYVCKHIADFIAETVQFAAAATKSKAATEIVGE